MLANLFTVIPSFSITSFSSLHGQWEFGEIGKYYRGRPLSILLDSKLIFKYK